MTDRNPSRKRGIRPPVLAALLMLAGTVGLTEDSNRGYELYVQYQCHQCHGYEGQGGAPGGPRLTSLGYAFETFAKRTRYPDLMPAYSPDVLNDEDLSMIYDYIRSIPEPAAVEGFPILRDALGDGEI